MSEHLLDYDQVAMRLSVTRRTIVRHLPSLKANGLQQVNFGKRGVRFRAASLDRMIERAAEREEAIF